MFLNSGDSQGRSEVKVYAREEKLVCLKLGGSGASSPRIFFLI